MTQCFKRLNTEYGRGLGKKRGVKNGSIFKDFNGKAERVKLNLGCGLGTGYLRQLSFTKKLYGFRRDPPCYRMLLMT